MRSCPEPSPGWRYPCAQLLPRPLWPKMAGQSRSIAGSEPATVLDEDEADAVPPPVSRPEEVAAVAARTAFGSVSTSIQWHAKGRSPGSSSAALRWEEEAGGGANKEHSKHSQNSKLTLSKKNKRMSVDGHTWEGTRQPPGTPCARTRCQPAHNKINKDQPHNDDKWGACECHRIHQVKSMGKNKLLGAD